MRGFHLLQEPVFLHPLDQPGDIRAIDDKRTGQIGGAHAVGLVGKQVQHVEFRHRQAVGPKDALAGFFQGLGGRENSEYEVHGRKNGRVS